MEYSFYATQCTYITDFSIIVLFHSKQYLLERSLLNLLRLSGYAFAYIPLNAHIPCIAVASQKYFYKSKQVTHLKRTAHWAKYVRCLILIVFEISIVVLKIMTFASLQSKRNEILWYCFIFNLCRLHSDILYKVLQYCIHMWQ